MRVIRALLLVAALATCAGPAAVAPTPTESPTPTPTPSPSPSPSPSPTEQAAAAYLIDGTYAFVLLPPAVEAQALASLQTDALKVFIRSGAVRSVTKGGDATGAAVLVLAIDPSYAALPNAFDSFVSGLASTAAVTTPERETIAGRTVAVMFSSGQKLWYVVWQHRSFFVTEFATARNVAEDIAAALIAANSR